MIDGWCCLCRDILKNVCGQHRSQHLDLTMYSLGGWSALFDQVNFEGDVLGPQDRHLQKELR